MSSTSTDVTVPGDPSQAAFWLVAASIVPGSDVTVEDVYVGRARVGFLDVLERMGAEVELVEQYHRAAAADAGRAVLVLAHGKN